MKPHKPKPDHSTCMPIPRFSQGQNVVGIISLGGNQTYMREGTVRRRWWAFTGWDAGMWHYIVQSRTHFYKASGRPMLHSFTEMELKACDVEAA
jgi:hypothetical protein